MSLSGGLAGHVSREEGGRGQDGSLLRKRVPAVDSCCAALRGVLQYDSRYAGSMHGQPSSMELDGSQGGGGSQPTALQLHLTRLASVPEELPPSRAQAPAPP